MSPRDISVIPHSKESPSFCVLFVFTNTDIKYNFNCFHEERSSSPGDSQEQEMVILNPNLIC